MKLLAEKLNHHFHDLLLQLPPLPDGTEWLMPLQNEPETARIFRLFLAKYYADGLPRSLILGINPGRFGGGLTNVAFTDPAHLERECGIENTFPKREELSAQFIWKVIHAYGGASDFFGRFFVNSVVPYGFVKDGKNWNYYDDKLLEKTMTPFATTHLKGLLDLGMSRKTCFCLGEGKNFKFLSKLNEKEGFFDKIVPLPHPRFIMQYRRKRVEEFVEMYIGELGKLEIEGIGISNYNFPNF